MGRERTPEEVAARKAKKERKKEERATALEAAAAAAAAAPAPRAKQKPAAVARPAPAKLTKDAIENAVSIAEWGFTEGIRLASMLNPSKVGYQSALKEAWKSLPVKRRNKLVRRDRELGTSAANESPKVPDNYPFHVEPSDHCETSPQAYAHVEPFLELLAERMGKPREKLRVWDPYYCTGAVKRHLGSLGFPKVHNVCEDFYKIIQSGEVPRHHVVVTNPPYSEPPGGEPPHAARLLRFLRENGKPYLLNMPEYCASAAYYRELFPTGAEDAEDGIAGPPALLCPYSRYHFWSPSELKAAKNRKAHRRKDLGFRNAPFVALWYVNLAPHVDRKELLSLAYQGKLRHVDTLKGPSKTAKARLCAKLKQLPEGRETFKRKAVAKSANEGQGEEPTKKLKKAADPTEPARPQDKTEHPSGLNRKERRKLQRAPLQWTSAVAADA